MQSIFSCKNKKGQQEAGAMAAAALIAIIALLIIVYILFLPPSEREKILEGEENVSEEEEDISVLLSESPERLYPLDQREFELELPSVNIFTKEEATEFKKLDSLYVSRSLISDKKAIVEFDVLDIKDTEDVLLNFIVAESKGRLSIRLNNIKVYDKEITTVNIDPIELEEGLIQGKNILEFSASSPGAAFWRKNRYSLEDILITGNVVERGAQASKVSFFVSESERDNLRKVKLHFYPDCDLATVNRLEIWINNYNLYSAIPDCGMPNRAIEFSPDKLVPGENKLIFETEKGSYLVDQIKLTSELEKVEAKTYYFQLTEDEYDDVKDGFKDVLLYLRFIDDTSDKIAKIIVNGNDIRLDQTDIDFERNIDNFVVEGNNALKIEPEEALDIAELKVSLEE